jgi:CRISPR type III-B/RAMP module RAMP protein Cmr6
MSNLHKLFYKDYYKCEVEIEEDRNGKKHKVSKKVSYHFLTDESNSKKIQGHNNKILNHPDGVNKSLINATLEPIPNEVCVWDDKTNSFSLKTLYPGLITGVGIDHEAGVEGEFKLGIHFDYTYGMPVIYGSSVKGVLKTYFKDFAKDFDNSFIEDELKEFEKDIFEGKNHDKNSSGNKKPIYCRDIFFDAIIAGENEKGKILDSDTLCPHNENPLKNPNPISFLKIASGVIIQFRFKLVDSKIGNKEIKVIDKLAIFENILTTVGIGAKTNVGYGQFTKI